ncbi:hypothetical protein [Methylorubrum sp. B1-46]|uniref:hypothetical protein n=1 Tax=Methylorubrum sp. B1-46 TaxID=2897334 RepID=UPI001E4C2004|nr:hypothetical protein [Methylorubrum sp. B1-46]
MTAFAILFLGSPMPSMAQAITNVNECTFITDPIALRRCIDGFQLRGPAAQYPQSAPIPPVESPAQAERDQLNSKTPPAANYKDSPEWLGSADKAPNRFPLKRGVIDLNK